MDDVEGEIHDTGIMWGCIVRKWQDVILKDGRVKRYGPYCSHVTKKPPKFNEKQCWDYIGKEGSERYNQAIAWLKEHPLLPNSKNPAVRVGKNGGVFL
jgi:hypothetical protein